MGYVQKEYVEAPKPMGDRQWIEYVFGTGPARRTKGRTKHTQHHQKFLPEFGWYEGTQGRREAHGLLALQYLRRLGLIKRFKSQAFKTDQDEFGSEIYPDFALELPNNAICPVEVKNKRFLTRDIQFILDENRKNFANFDLKYIVWTDDRPFRHCTRHHLLNMSKSAGEHIPKDEIDELVALVEEERAVDLAALYDRGFDLSAIYFAAWHGLLFFPLMQPWAPTSQITATRRESLESIFLESKPLLDEWWNSL